LNEGIKLNPKTKMNLTGLIREIGYLEIPIGIACFVLLYIKAGLSKEGSIFLPSNIFELSAC